MGVGRGVRLEEGQRAGAWRGSSQSAANGFQGPVKWKSLQERGRERPLSLERGCRPRLGGVLAGGGWAACLVCDGGVGEGDEGSRVKLGPWD